jgi:hypothetical protein
MLGPIFMEPEQQVIVGVTIRLRNIDRGSNADTGTALLAAIAPDDPHVVENRRSL